MLLCPKCTQELHITDRQGIEIDFCPTCRGVWLDAGELEKIIERTVHLEMQFSGRPDSRSEQYYDDEPRYRDDRSDRGPYGKKYKKKSKKKHVLEEIFDIFD